MQIRLHIVDTVKERNSSHSILATNRHLKEKCNATKAGEFRERGAVRERGRVFSLAARMSMPHKASDDLKGATVESRFEE